MRKFVLSAFAVALTTALALAGEVHFVAYDKEKKELKVKEGDKEKTYKISDKTAVKNGDKDVKDKGKALERFENDRGALACLASSLFTCLNQAREEVTDDDEIRFMEDLCGWLLQDP